MNAPHDPGEPRTRERILLSPAFRNAVLGAAGVVAVLMAMRASQLSAPHPLCVAAGVLALAFLIVLQPMIDRASRKAHGEDQAFEASRARLTRARLAALISLVAMTIGHVVAAWRYSMRLEAGPSGDAPSILVEAGVVFLAYAVSSFAVFGLVFPAEARLDAASERDSEPGGSASLLTNAVVLLALLGTFVMAAIEVSRVVTTEGAELDLLRVLPLILVFLAGTVAIYGPRKARHEILASVVFGIVATGGAILISWTTGLPMAFAMFAAIIVVGLIVQVIVYRSR